MNQITIEMSKFECSVCGAIQWVFPANDTEIRKLRCPECYTTILAMQNIEQIEINIEKIQGEQI